MKIKMLIAVIIRTNYLPRLAVIPAEKVRWCLIPRRCNPLVTSPNVVTASSLLSRLSLR